MDTGHSFLSPKLVLRDRPPFSPGSTWRHESSADTTTAYMLPNSENPVQIGSANSVDGEWLGGVINQIWPKFEICKFQEKYLRMIGYFLTPKSAFRIPFDWHYLRRYRFIMKHVRSDYVQKHGSARRPGTPLLCRGGG